MCFYSMGCFVIRVKLTKMKDKMNLKKIALIALIALTPLVSSAADWTGSYAGLVAGVGMPSTIVDDYDCYITCTSWNENSKMGVTYGIDAGYNWNLSPAVLVGVEADISGTTFKGHTYSANWGGSGAGHDSKWNSLTTLRGRAGLVVDNALLYATGGLALVDLNATGVYPSNPAAEYNASGKRLGLVGGVGFEYKLAAAPWSVKTEALYVSTPGHETMANGATQDYMKYKVTASATLVRVGMNYKF